MTDIEVTPNFDFKEKKFKINVKMSDHSTMEIDIGDIAQMLDKQIELLINNSDESESEEFKLNIQDVKLSESTTNGNAADGNATKESTKKSAANGNDKNGNNTTSAANGNDTNGNATNGNATNGNATNGNATKKSTNKSATNGNAAKKQETETGSNQDTQIINKIIEKHNKLVEELITDGKKIIESIENINNIKKEFFKEKNGGGNSKDDGGDSKDDGGDSKDDGGDSEDDSISPEIMVNKNSNNTGFVSITNPLTSKSPSPTKPSFGAMSPHHEPNPSRSGSNTSEFDFNTLRPGSKTSDFESKTPRPGSNTSDFESNPSRPPYKTSEFESNGSYALSNTSVTDNVYFIKEIDLQDIHPFKEIIIIEQQTQKEINSDYDIDFMLLYKFFKNLDKLGQDKIKEKEGHENDYQETLQYFKDNLLTPENELKELIKKFLNKLKMKVLFRLLNKYFENLTNNTDNDKIIPNKIKIQKLLEKVNENNEFSNLKQDTTLSNIPDQQDNDITFFVEKLNNLFVTETKESNSETPEQNIIKNIFEKKKINKDGNCLFNTLRTALSKKSEKQKESFNSILDKMINDNYKGFKSDVINAQVKKFILFYTHFMKPIKKEVDEVIKTATTHITEPSNPRRSMFRTHYDDDDAINESIKYAINEGNIIKTIIDENKDKLKYVKEAIQIFYELKSDDDIDNRMHIFVKGIVKGIISEEILLRNDESSTNDTNLNGFLINELHEYAINGGDAVYGNGKHITFYTNVFNIRSFNVTTSDSVTRISPNPIMFANDDDDDGDRPLYTLSSIQILKNQEHSQEIEEQGNQNKKIIKNNLEGQINKFDLILNNNINSGGYIKYINTHKFILNFTDNNFVNNIIAELNGKDVAEQKTILEEEKEKLENKKKKLEGELYEIDKIEEKEFLKEEFRQNNKEYFLFTTEGINSNANHYDYLEKKEYFEDYEISIFYEPEKIIMIS